MIKYVIVAIVSGMLSAFSQVLLKKSSQKSYTSKIREYLNIYVISGYAMLFGCMVLMIIAYKGLPFKYGAIIESLVYIYIMVLGKIFFDEKITFKKILGNCLIMAGVIVFSL